MSITLIDTDIASFLFKGSRYADPYRPLLEGHELALSFTSVAELYQWARLRHWGDRRIAQLEQSLSAYLAISVDRPLCQTWAQVRAERQHSGQPISPQDAWIAATALRHNLPLVTHNRKDYLGIPELQLLEPDT
ncbi:MAG: type II toxin-antitoxin system VapC family toxin [Geitlerinemataceae cyanobacterium]